jgi:hypothetical protein
VRRLLPVACIAAARRDDRTIALLYILYRRSDPLCCPTGGGKIVRFRWNVTRLVSLDGIPTNAFSAPVHR